MSGVVADTHALIWYLFEPSQLSADALAVLRQTASAGEPICAASISLVEACYLVEKGRVPASALEHLINVLNGAPTALVVISLDLVVAKAVAQIPRDAVPDMPDRIIAATAFHLGIPLVTRDQKLRAVPMIKTIW